jgi:hypothetical protein
MVSALEEYFLQKGEPDKSCLQSLREIILSQDEEITETMKYGMPFYCIRGKMCCYLWTHKNTNNRISVSLKAPASTIPN